MNLTSLFQKHSLRALLAIPLALAVASPPASAQKIKPAPQALALLDICHDELKGSWRYSGVVSVLTGAPVGKLMVNVDSQVQNKVSAEGYLNAFTADTLAGDAPLSNAGNATVVRFDTEAAPLSLGTVRSTSQVVIHDPLNPLSAPQTLQAMAEFTAAVCGCQHPKGCTRTQGYWGNKPGVVWPAPYSRGATFFSSGITWQQIMDTPPKGGNAYLILAHQYIAAVLNRAGGASAPSGLQTVIDQARGFFLGGANLDTCSGSQCETQKNWAGILDTYNNGLYPNAPKHCTD